MDGLTCTGVLDRLERGCTPTEHDAVADHLAACPSCAERATRVGVPPLDEGLEQRLLELFRTWRGAVP
jgi:hypothetical protein